MRQNIYLLIRTYSVTFDVLKAIFNESSCYSLLSITDLLVNFPNTQRLHLKRNESTYFKCKVCTGLCARPNQTKNNNPCLRNTEAKYSDSIQIFCFAWCLFKWHVEAYYVAFLVYYTPHLQNKTKTFSFAKKNAFPLFTAVSEYLHFLSPLSNCYNFNLCQTC